MEAQETRESRETQVYAVSDITGRIGMLLGSDKLLQGVSVEGELSNYRKQNTGHVYFTLKDSNSQLRCAMFKSVAEKIHFTPQDGMKLICYGRIDIYPRDGVYQLIVTNVRPAGVGDLHAEFERLKARLAREGLFEESHKKPIPRSPGRIAVITSPTGAAVRDIIRILKTRWPLTDVCILPVRVQGDEAPREIAAAIKYANAYKVSDVIITGRGGGSIEDLWCFNDEIVARAIYDSVIPVISAVGHEPDVTIADYVADMRASTPSNAAERAVPDRSEVSQNLAAGLKRVTRDMERTLASAAHWLGNVSERRVMKSPEAYISVRRSEVNRLSERVGALYERALTKPRGNLASLTATLQALNPHGVVRRGYAIARDSCGHVIRSARDLKINEKISVNLSDGEINAGITEVKYYD